MAFIAASYCARYVQIRRGIRRRRRRYREHFHFVGPVMFPNTEKHIGAADMAMRFGNAQTH